MMSALFELKLFSLVFTALLWRWSLLHLHAVPFDFKKNAYDHNRITSISYFMLLVVIAFTPAEKQSPLISILSSICCGGTYATFSILDNSAQNSLWQKGRNRLATLCGLALLSFGLGWLVNHSSLIPVLFALLIAQSSHQRNQATLAATMADLDAVRKKILEVNAHQVAEKIMEDYASTTSSLKNHAS